MNQDIQEPKKILIVEDEELLAKVLQDEFSAAGFQVLLAHDGEDGLKQAQSYHPDIMLIDLQMPKMDGLTMLKQLREDATTQKIPVIVLTNVNDAETTAQAVLYQAYDYLLKTDWQPKDLVKRVKEKLHLIPESV